MKYFDLDHININMLDIYDLSSATLHLNREQINNRNTTHNRVFLDKLPRMGHKSALKSALNPLVRGQLKALFCSWSVLFYLIWTVSSVLSWFIWTELPFSLFLPHNCFIHKVGMNFFFDSKCNLVEMWIFR